MSKFKETFSHINASDELKENVNKRIARDKANQENRAIKKSKNPFIKHRKGLIAAAVILAVVMAFPSYAMIKNASANARYDFSKAIQVKSEKQLSSLLNNASGGSVSLSIGCSKASPDMGGNTAAPESPEMSTDMAVSESAPSMDYNESGSAEHSETNVQVDGMDEGDLVKNDGEYIYRLSGSGFSIVRAVDGNLSKVCYVPIKNFSPIEMYVREKQLVLVGGGYKIMPYYTMDSLMGGGYMSCYNYHSNVEIRVFDLSDIENPLQTNFYQIEGNYNTSRIAEESNKLYFMVNYYNYYYYDNYGQAIAQEKRPYFATGENAEAAPLPVEDIYYFKNIPNKSYMILGALDLNVPAAEPEIKAYLSCAGITYVSGENIYTSSTQWFYNALGSRNGNLSYIAKFSLEDLSFTGSNSVKGSPKDRYCLDEYEGYLRVATSYGAWSSTDISASAVYVFDKDMKEISRISDIAPGEAIDSASFSKEKGYISTSVRMVDPLFIIDFSDVFNPAISQGLKESGISNYLKAIGDTGYVLGFGTDSALNQYGWSERTGVKVQLYDMTGAEPVSKEKLTIDGNSSYAEVLYNPKALLYMYDEDTKKGLIGFAAECAAYSYSSNYNYIIKQQGLYLYSFDADAGTLVFEGLLSNFDTSKNVYNYSYSNYEWEEAQSRYSKYVSRGIVIGDYIYTVSDSIITSYDRSDLSQAAKLELN